MRSRTVQPIQRRANKRDDREEKKRRKKRSGLDKIFIRGNTQYFDFDLLLVIIFLMCFGLVMLYSTSAYSAQADFNNDMFYFFKTGVCRSGEFRRDASGVADRLSLLRSIFL